MSAGGPPRENLGVLLDRAALGDHQAFGDFVDRTATKAHALVTAMGRSDAADCLETCYVEAWHDVHQFSSEELSPLAWFLTRLYLTVRHHSEP